MPVSGFRTQEWERTGQVGGLGPRCKLAQSGLMCIIHTMNSATLIEELKANGFVLVSVRGSHHKFRNAAGVVTSIVPHPKKDLGNDLVKAIRKQSGIGNPPSTTE